MSESESCNVVSSRYKWRKCVWDGFMRKMRLARLAHEGGPWTVNFEKV